MKYIFIWNGKIIETARGTRGDVSEKPYQSPATAATEHPQKKKKKAIHIERSICIDIP